MENELLNLIQGADVKWKSLWEVTTWDKRFNAVDNSKQNTIIKYDYLLAKDLKNLQSDTGNVKLLTTNVSNLWTTEEVASNYEISDGEVVTIPWGGTANVQYYKGKFLTADNRLATSSDLTVLDNKYLYYFMMKNQPLIQSFYRGSGIQHPSMKKVLDLKIPIPSLEIQQKVVEILDKMTDYVKELTAELTLRQKQYAYYRDQLLTFPSLSNSDEPLSVRWMTLGEISSKISTGVTPKAGNPDYYENGTIPWLRTNEVKFNEIYSTEKLVTQKAFDETSIKWVPENSIIVAISGATAGRVAINKIPLTTNQHCCCISLNDSQVDYKFVYHWLVKQNDKILELKQGARGDLNMGMLRRFKIPVPSLSDQKRIVEILDKFDKLTSDLSEGLPREIRLRQKQYEYWREQLLSFRNNI